MSWVCACTYCRCARTAWVLVYTSSLSGFLLLLIRSLLLAAHRGGKSKVQRAQRGADTMCLHKE